MMAPAPLQDLQRIAAAGLKVVEEPSLRVIFLGLNMRPELLAAPGQKNPMLDKRVRQAMWQAIDLDTIQKRVMRGKSRNIGVMVAPPVPGYDAALDKSCRSSAPTARRSCWRTPAIRTASRPSSTARTTATSPTSRSASRSRRCGSESASTSS